MSERELARIIQQMRGKLEHKEALLAEAFEVLREFARDEPTDHEYGDCIYCDSGSSEATENGHEPNCPWIRAKGLITKHFPRVTSEPTY